jgi:nucleotide-binding universal stress UspA family protein
MPKLSKIVAGVDFSHRSHQAVSWAAQYLAPEAEFVLVHAMEMPVPPSFLGESAGQHMIADELQKSIREDMDALVARLNGARHQVEFPLGPASTALSEVAERENADLILVGPHGERGGIEGLLGSTAERVLAQSTIPVLLAAGDFTWAPQKILVAIDDTSMRHGVLEWAKFLGDRYGATVRAFHCLDARLFGRMRLVSSAGRIEEMTREAKADGVDWVRAQLRNAGLPADENSAIVSVGAPAHAISDLACDGCDLVIIGSRREGAAQRIFLGSVAKKVIRSTCVPVLMVPVRD